MTCRALIIAAPASGSGKTVVTASLLRAFQHRGLRVAALKVGPDFIDPAFHAVATGRPCRNIDGWAMRPCTLRHQVSVAARDADVLIIEGVMGLFDGSASGEGSTADIAALLDLPVILVQDVSAQSTSAAAVALGFARYRDDVKVAGVILNRLGGDRHRELIEPGFARIGLRVLGGIIRNDALTLQSRHLGLVQAHEHPRLDAFLNDAAEIIARSLDLEQILQVAQPLKPGASSQAYALAPLGNHMAVARDDAFAFAYPHLIEGWREQGAAVTYFSPLADEPPDAQADSVFLPGGYPELHAARLGAGERWKHGLRDFAKRGRLVYGECGGFMALGRTLTDANGVSHDMSGLLPLQSSFATRRLTMAYRTVSFLRPMPGIENGQLIRGHEFHYATFTQDSGAQPLFRTESGECGLSSGSVCGSFMHLIDQR